MTTQVDLELDRDRSRVVVVWRCDGEAHVGQFTGQAGVDAGFVDKVAAFVPPRVVGGENAAGGEIPCCTSLRCTVRSRGFKQ